MGPLRVGVAGCWHVHAADHAAAAQAHPETELVAVWDDDTARGATVAERFGVELLPDLEALLARDDISGVTVTTATAAHRDVVARVLQAGKHVFVEKLLAPTVDEATELVALAGRLGRVLVVALPRLAHGWTVAFDEAVARGALGDVTYARVRLAHDGAVGGWLPERFFAPGEAVGGALSDLGSHPLYLVQRFLGARPERVAATYASHTGRALEDQAVVTLAYPGGVLGVAEVSFTTQRSFAVEVHGTAGSLTLRDGVLRVFAGGEDRELTPPPDGPDPFAQWVGHIRAGTRADANLKAAIELTRLVVAANRSAATGHAVVP